MERERRHFDEFYLFYGAHQIVILVVTYSIYTDDVKNVLYHITTLMQNSQYTLFQKISVLSDIFN